MKLWTIFCFEFTYQIRRRTTWLYLGVLLVFTLLMNLVTTPGDGVYPNNTFHITAVTVIGGFIWLIMGAAVAGEAAARDLQTRMHPLTYTAPVTKLHYLGGRFLAALAVNALLLLSLPVGALLSFYLPGMESGELLPFRPLIYGNVYFFIALPGALVATALQFSLAALNRRVMTSYLASLLLALVAQIIALAMARLFGNWDLVKLLDPVGVTGIIGNELQTWTATEKNTRLIMLEGMFLLNRVLWLSVALGLLLLTYFRFRFTHQETHHVVVGLKRRPNLPPETFTATRNKAPAISVPQVSRSFNFATYFYQTFTLAGAFFKKIAQHPAGLTLVAALVLVSVISANRIITQFGIPLLPTTPQVLSYLATPISNISSPWVIIPLLIMYYSGELVWRERDAGLQDLIDATPVPEWVFFIGKFLGLSLIIVVWMVLLLAEGIGMQLNMGYYTLDLGLYLQVLFLLQLPDYLIFALLALVVHVVVNQKYIGYLVMLLVFGFIAFPGTFQVEHPMLIFGASPGWSYTDMRGFGTTLGPWLWFKFYWIAWALFLAVAANLLWPRGREQGLKYRLQLARHRFTPATAWVTVIVTGLVLTLGSFIFYNTNILNEYLSSADLNKRKAEYEQRYSQFRNTPQPQLTATKLHAEIYPDQQQVEIRAAYTLVNKNTVPINSIHMGSTPGVKLSAVKFNRSAVGVVKDKERSYYIYALKQALQPGDSLQLNFVVTHKQRGFQMNNTHSLVVKNGTFFTNYDLLPSIGYQSRREIKDAVLRKKYKLAPRPTMPSLYDLQARNKPFSNDQSTFEATVGTAKEEIAVTPGSLKKTWTVGNRRYFRYKTDAAIGGEYAFFSGNYAVHKSKWQHVAIRIYYHPGHVQNIDRMLQSVKASLRYYTEQFGAYPYGHLTVVEHAGSGGGGGASADASLIYYGEQYSLMNPDDSPQGFDLPYYILAHEVAHQWWGMARLSPANVEGAGVLIEGLAVYAGMQVLEKYYGQNHLRQYVNYLHSAYEMPRSLASASLLRANEEFLYYRKGGLAMHALSKYIGQAKVNGALQRLLQKHSSGELPLPTTLDLYQELQQVTPDSLHYLLRDLFQQNTYWRLKTKQVTANPTKAGNWQVTLRVQAQKIVVDSTGLEKEVPMHDWLEVGLYEEDKDLSDPLYQQMHRIRTGEQTIKLTVPRKPISGGIDPNYLLIDLRLEDNVIQVEK
ncbi:ABC transporter permease [Adhaeribacter swui]|uniref:ABC transporter permease n=1 Tax=Adhaeribacter swui TaxID=2086471 RepID=A0A7G7GA45_9BACT|nr:M1 family aminopeptidase [Adhaeribacter swui]QNF34029.1 ABC transporter permease [Adhaeribacter swui]